MKPAHPVAVSLSARWVGEREQFHMPGGNCRARVIAYSKIGFLPMREKPHSDAVA